MHKIALQISAGLVLLSLAGGPPAAAQPLFGPPSNPYLAPPATYGHPIRWTLRHDLGDRIGYDQGLTWLGVFIPLGEIQGDSLLFCDLQPMVYNDGNFGSNLGLGFRVLGPDLNRVYGLYGYYDYRQTDHNSFRQFTLGFDSLGTVVDFRGNLYLPDQKTHELPASAVRPPHFAGHELRFGGYEYSMLGGDLEAGLVLPELFNTQSRLLAGIYHFDLDYGRDTTGVRVRLETQWSARLSTDLAVYDDSHFGTSVVLGISLNWLTESHSNWRPGIGAVRRGPQRHLTQHASDRLAEPTYRLPNIAVSSNTHVARNADGPWRFLHVDSTAGRGSGSFEHPFSRLEDALAAAPPGSIVYTPHGGIYQPDQMLVVPQSVSLFSNATEHWINTQSGPMQLPQYDPSGYPEIHSSVYLSSGAAIDGFYLVGSGDTLDLAGMIRSVGESDIAITRNAFSSRREAIWLEDVSGATLTDNYILAAESAAIRLDQVTGASIARNWIEWTSGSGITAAGGGVLDIADNRIEQAGASGVALQNVQQAGVTGNRIDQAGDRGIAASGVAGLSITDNVIGHSSGSGIELAETDGAILQRNQIGFAEGDGIAVADSADLQIFNNQIDRAGGQGIAVIGGDGASIQENLVRRSGGDGIRVQAGAEALVVNNRLQTIDGSGITIAGGAEARIAGNLIERAYVHGISIVDGVDAYVTDNHIVMAGAHGIRILDSAKAHVLDNQVDEATGDGIHIGQQLLDVGFEGVVSNNGVGQAQSGIWINVSQAFQGEISLNTLSDNRQYGMYLQAGTILEGARIDSNAFYYNGAPGGREGLSILVTGPSDPLAEDLPLLDVQNNEFKLNNVVLGTQHGEFLMRLAPGAGPLTVRLGGNTSFNQVQPGEFNFDFRSGSPLNLNYELTGPNLGSIGSSDGSVPPPAP